MKKYVKLKEGKPSLLLEQNKVYKITGVCTDKSYMSGIKISINLDIHSDDFGDIPTETFFDAEFFEFLGSQNKLV